MRNNLMMVPSLLQGITLVLLLTSMVPLSSAASAISSDPLTVILRGSSTIVLHNPATTAIGKPIIFYGKVIDTSSGTKSIPTGTVSWSDGGAGGSFSSSSCTLAQYSTSTSTSICAVTYTPATAGPITITGTYSGDGTHSTSSGTSALTVTLRATTTIDLVVPQGSNSVAFGSPRTIYAKIIDTSSGTRTIPTGTASWSDGGAGGSFNSASCTLSQYSTSTSTSICAVTYTAPINTGPVTITATYSGDSTHGTSFGTLPLTVTLRATITNIYTPPTTGTGDTYPVSPISLVTFVEDISTGTRTMATGTVSWSDNGAGGSFSLNPCTLVQSLSGAGKCGVTYTPAGPGTVTVTYTYSGDSTHLPSGGQGNLYEFV